MARTPEHLLGQLYLSACTAEDRAAAGDAELQALRDWQSQTLRLLHQLAAGAVAPARLVVAGDTWQLLPPEPAPPEPPPAILTGTGLTAVPVLHNGL